MWGMETKPNEPELPFDQLLDHHKVNFRSLEPIAQYVKDLDRAVEKYKLILFAKDAKEDKVPTQAAILNAIMLWLEKQPQEEQFRIIAFGMRRLNAMMRRQKDPMEETPPGQSESGSEVRPHKAVRRVIRNPSPKHTKSNDD